MISMVQVVYWYAEMRGTFGVIIFKYIGLLVCWYVWYFGMYDMNDIIGVIVFLP